MESYRNNLIEDLKNLKFDKCITLIPYNGDELLKNRFFISLSI